MSDPLDPLRKIRARLEAACRPLGLDLAAFTVVVGEDGPDHAQVMFRLVPERLDQPDEAISADTFAEMMKGANEAGLDTKSQEAEASLRRLMGDL